MRMPLWYDITLGFALGVGCTLVGLLYTGVLQ